MTLSRRRFTIISLSGLSATLFTGAPLLADPDNAVKPPTGATTTKKKEGCCVDSKKIQALKKEIRKLAQIHNQMSRGYKSVKKLAGAAMKEIPKSRLKVSGLSLRKELELEKIVKELNKFRNGGNRSMVEDLDKSNSLIRDAEIYCKKANQSKDCKVRKAMMKKSISALGRAIAGMEFTSTGLALARKRFNSLPPELKKLLPKTKQVMSKALMSDPPFKKPSQDLKKMNREFAAFRRKMNAGC